MTAGVEVGSGFVSILPSARGFGRRLSQETGPDVERVGREHSSRFSKGFLGGLGSLKSGFVALGAGLAAGGLLKGTISAASDLNESMGKVGVVFGSSAGQVQKFAKTAATSMGQTTQQALEAAGTFGNLLTALKIAPQSAAGMSTSLVKLAGDLASFNNVDPAQALDALRSGLTGETEPLKRFGVNMNDATLRAEALKLGLIKNVKDALNPSVKAQAAYALILDQTKTAQGDFARTSGGLANQQRILSAQFGNLKASIGTALLPVAVRAVKFLNATMIPAFGKLKAPVQRAGAIITGFARLLKTGDLTGGFLRALGLEEDSNITGLLVKITGSVRALGQAFLTKVLPALQRFGGYLATTVLPAVARLVLEFESRLLPVYQRVAAFIGSTVIPALQRFGAFLQANVLPQVQRFAAYMQANVGPAFARVGTFITSRVLPPLQRFGGFLVGTVLPAAIRVGRFLADTFTPTFQQLGRFITGSVVPALAGIAAKLRENSPQLIAVAKLAGGFIAVLVALSLKITGKVLPVLLKIAGFLTTTLADAIGTAIGVFGTFVTAIGKSIGFLLGLLGKTFGALGHLPDFMGGDKFKAAADAINGAKDAVDGFNASLDQSGKKAPGVAPARPQPAASITGRLDRVDSRTGASGVQGSTSIGTLYKDAKITVVAQDPDEMNRKLEHQRRVEALR